MTETAPQRGETLAAFLADPPPIPPEALHEARRAVLGFLTCGLAGTADPAWRIVRDVALAAAAPGEARVIGAATADVPTAVFLNAVAGNVLDFDDTHLPTVIHPSAPVVPVVLALAGEGAQEGRRALERVVLAFEAMARLGLAVHPGHYRAGWHITATCGVVGAAVAAGLSTGLSAPALGHAMAIAAGQGAGLIANLAEPAKTVPVGNAARDGLMSARYAAAGLTGSPAALDGRFGFVDVLGRGGDPDALVAGLGRTWEILSNTHKPYPTGVVLNPVIDACLALRENPALDTARIAAVRVHGHPLLVDRTDRPVVGRTADARLSTQHAVAVTLLSGRPGLAAFAPAAIGDAAVAALRARVSVEAREDIPVEGARVAVSFEGDAPSLTAVIEKARGSVSNPMTDADLERKLKETLADAAPEADLDALAQAVWSLGEGGEARAVMAALPAPVAP